METLVMVLAAMAAMAAQMVLAVLPLTMLVNLIPTMSGVKAKRTHDPIIAVIALHRETGHNISVAFVGFAEGASNCLALTDGQVGEIGSMLRPCQCVHSGQRRLEHTRASARIFQNIVDDRRVVGTGDTVFFARRDDHLRECSHGATLLLGERMLC